MYAIIGAGPMGLCTARQLKKHGIDFVGFELHGDVGGLWDIDNPHSTMYHSAHLISSKGTTEFSEFPMRAEVAPYPHHSEMRRYFRDYARQFRLYDHYQFDTRVVHLQRQNRGWKLISERNGEQREWHFEGVLIANGTLHTPNRPRLPGDFSGELLHSSAYKSADIFAGKRVLVLGCGNSACDIAVDAVHRAASVDLSVRRGYYFLPKFILGKPTDTFGGAIRLPRRIKQLLDGLLIRALVGKPSQYGLPDPDYRLYESHPVMNSLVLHHIGHGDIRTRGDITAVSGHRVTFANGEQADYDLILMATGYKLDYPFIARSELNWPEGVGAPGCISTSFIPNTTTCSCSAWSRHPAWAGRGATSRPNWWRCTSASCRRPARQPWRCVRPSANRPDNAWTVAIAICNWSAWPTTCTRTAIVSVSPAMQRRCAANWQRPMYQPPREPGAWSRSRSRSIPAAWY